MGANTNMRKLTAFCVCIIKDNSEKEKNVKSVLKERRGEVEERILIWH